LVQGFEENAMPTRSVLLAEDNPDTQAILASMLVQRGFWVIPASNGAEALDQLASGADPCLILTDLMMPVMDGAELLARRKRDARFRHIPAVVYSGHPDALELLADSDVSAFVGTGDGLERVVAVAERLCS
jgi:CheY-like chemotaxis protein